jgi:hypothetical protein
MTPERKEEIATKHGNKDWYTLQQYIKELLAALEEAEQQAEKHRKVAEAKILFVNQGNNEYVYGLQEDLIEAQQTIARQKEKIDAALSWTWNCSEANMLEVIAALRGDVQP